MALRSFISAFEIMKSEIVFRNREIDEVLSLICEYCGGTAESFFRQIRENGKSLDKAYIDAEYILKKDGLKSEDISEIESLMLVLGRYDSATQAEHIDRALKRLEGLKEHAANEQEKNGKLYGALGLCAGIMLAVILI